VPFDSDDNMPNIPDFILGEKEDNLSLVTI
jgi:hypothetical protein